MTTPITLPPRGIIGATLTPFTKRGSVSPDLLHQELDLLTTHCDAVSILGPEVSEYRSLSEKQRTNALSSGINTVDGRVPVIAGVSGQSPRTVLRRIDHAASAGASFVQVLIPRHPGGNAASLSDLVAYVTYLTSESALPIILYHNPTRGTDTGASTMIELCRIDGVVGIKESSRDLTKIGRLCQEIDDNGLARYYTTMQAVLPTLLLGGSGAMMPPPGTLIGAQVVHHFRAGNTDTAAWWQRQFRLWPGGWADAGLTTVMKASMALLGIDLGGPSEPFSPLPPDRITDLKNWIQDSGLTELFSAARQIDPANPSVTAIQHEPATLGRKAP
ncbi:4-hydroxy-tetrahydrodipicolinate synthase [Corynebacterium provencense]|uniref:4-hydroxy-tetrahydrodipicolinate synthase n=1 Tax=Corynebacterium provencense TaxID=1737425 RepID=A0A2Z3YPM1_9CORY|nr:dihydrodipicolinate synthase family protein [Corynebacterium provencense]AWT26742.1 4-hydroxy-tetrahydrodipicolinate synthase [Corynebacterium provencense]